MNFLRHAVDFYYNSFIQRGISQSRRRERRERFYELFDVQPGWKILDVGCGENFRSPWFDPTFDVTGLDYRPIEREHRAYEKFVCCDATNIPFPDQHFDLVFSNSLIEHLPTRDAQRQFAAEVMRVGKRFWIQTPNINFPVDPHYIVPFFQHLPPKTRSFFNFDGTVLELNGKQLGSLFPSARILDFPFAGISQSIVAVMDSEVRH